ncbi:hypothetical protein HSRCO_2010 [Halanaeroarchaeum sp. HSR-CO]|uniref:hypothetical protein n=1 Tax=Halanaeroarchaeum sp. HSR-CO TaxID=2866382 RepID=UPI00217DD575|nr:hypothetical protein [Halanaeroarchaeum sp. HSR-CO]UWG48285.1 hypothetical protein HSRCO_2010 [Halanaeroarchaeum sp. HSR-CO]
MSDWREWTYRVFVGRDVLAAYLGVLAVVWIALVADHRLLQIPGHILLVGFDVIQTALTPPFARPLFDVYRAGYLYGLAVVVAAIYRASR